MNSDQTCDLDTIASKISTALKDAMIVKSAERGVAAFFGATGWGKSTTINFLAGATIVATPKASGSKSMVLDVCDDEKSKFLRIGHKMKSETNTIAVLQVKDIVLCDMPGSNDTNAIDDIVNCVMRSKALREAREVRPVLVISYSEMKANRGACLRDAIEYCAQCFDSSANYSRLSVLITHAPQSTTDQDVYSRVNEQLISCIEDTECSPMCNALMSHIAQRMQEAEQSDEGNVVNHVGVVRPLATENRDIIFKLIRDNRSIQHPKTAFKDVLGEAAKKTLFTLFGRQMGRLRTLWSNNSFEEMAHVMNKMAQVSEYTEPTHKEKMLEWIVEENKKLYALISSQVSEFLSSAVKDVTEERVNALIGEPLGVFSSMGTIFDMCDFVKAHFVTIHHLKDEYRRKSCEFVAEQLNSRDWHSIDGCWIKVVLLDSALDCKGASEELGKGLEALFADYSNIIESGIRQDSPETSSIGRALYELSEAKQMLTEDRHTRAEAVMAQGISGVVENLEVLLSECLNLANIVISSFPCDESEMQSFQGKLSKLFRICRDNRIDDHLPETMKNLNRTGFFSRFKAEVPWQIPSKKTDLLRHSNLLHCLSKIDDDELEGIICKRRLDLKQLIATIVEYDLSILSQEYSSLVRLLSSEKLRAQNGLFDENTVCLDEFIRDSSVQIGVFLNAAKEALNLLIVDRMTKSNYCGLKLGNFISSFADNLEQLVSSTPSEPFLDAPNVLKCCVVVEICNQQVFVVKAHVFLVEEGHKLEFFADEGRKLLTFYESLLQSVNEKIGKICAHCMERCSSLNYESCLKDLKWLDDAAAFLKLQSRIGTPSNPSEATRAEIVKRLQDFLSHHSDEFEKCATVNDLGTFDIKPMLSQTRILLPLLNSPNMRASTTIRSPMKNFNVLVQNPNHLEWFLQMWETVLEQFVTSSEAARISSLSAEHRLKLLDNLDAVLKSKEIKTLSLHWQGEGSFGAYDFQRAHQALLKSYEQNMTAAIQALSEEVPDFALVAGHVDSALEHEKNDLLQKVFAKLKKDGTAMLELVKTSDFSDLEDDELKNLQTLLRKFKELEQSSLFPKFSEEQQNVLANYIEESKAELTKCKEKIDLFLKGGTYSGDCVRCFQVLKWVSKIYPQYFKDSKAGFESHFNEIIENPNVEQSIAVIKKLINHSSSHTVSQVFRKTFGSDWDHYIETFAGKVKSCIEEKHLLIEECFLKENVAAAESYFKSVDSLMEDLSVCHLCQLEKQKHLDLMARRTNLLQHHAKTVSDLLEEKDFSNAARLLCNVSLEKRPEIFRIFRLYANKLKDHADEEMPISPKERRVVFISSCDFLASLKSIGTEVDNDVQLQNISSILQEIVQGMEGMFWKDLQSASDSILGDLKFGISQKEMSLGITGLSDFKRLILLPTDKMSQSIGISQKVKVTIDKMIDFIQKSQTFLEDQMRHIQGDNLQLDTKNLRIAIHNVYKNKTAWTEMEDVLKKIADREQWQIPPLWGSYMRQFEDEFSDAISKKKKIIIRAANDGFSDSAMFQAFTTLSTLTAELGDDLNTSRIFEECQKHIAACLHDAAEQTINFWKIQDFDKLNSELDKLELASKQFQNSQSQSVKTAVSNEIQRARKPIMEELQKLKCNAYITDDGASLVCEKLNKIRFLAGKVPHILHAVITSISEVLQQVVERENNEFVGELGQSMLVSEWGKYSVLEQPLLRHIKAIGYLTKIPSLSPNDAVFLIKGFPIVDCKKLVGIIERYDEVFKKFVGDFIKNTDASYDIRKTRLCNIIKGYRSDTFSDGLELIAMVCTLVALIKSGESYGKLKGSPHLMAPHTMQIACLIRLMGLDSDQPSIFDHAASALSKKSKARSSEKISNHVMQIPTGEGKSIVLGVIACIFALQGLVVDCVCYSKYLSQRDYDDFKEVFSVLGVEGKIRCLTFQGLCEQHIQGVRESVLNLIHDKGPGADGFSLRVEGCEVSRILLIDEVDVFFKRQFYGSTLNAGTLLQSDTIEKLIRLIWTYRTRGISMEWAVQSSEYAAVVSEFAAIKPLIDMAVSGMLDGVKTFGTPRYELRGGKLGYVINNCFQSDVSFPYRTVFAYLHEHEANPSCITSDLVKQRIGIGEYSYAAIPRKYYGSIFGVTGTLTTLPASDKLVLQIEYEVTALTVAASVYGSTQLDFNPKEANHVMVEDNAANWRRKIADLVKREADNKRAVLVCFKNDVELNEFKRAYPNCSTQTLTSIEEDTDLFSIQGKVLNATMPQKVTLMTRKYGRGVDFGCNSKEVLGAGGLMIIQTFYSSTLSEESQIKGRVARQGEPGSYRLIVCAEQFLKKFGKMISAAMTKDELLKTMNDCREIRNLSKIRERNERKLVADQKDASAMSMVEALFNDNCPTSIKMERLIRNALGSPKRNYIVMIDVSGSMSNSWPSLCTAYNRFIESLMRNHSELDDITITLVFFDNLASIKDFKLSEAEYLSGPMPSTGGNHGTSFISAFEQCKRIVQNEADPARFCNIVFMTDGEGGDPTKVVKEMLQAHARRIIRYDCIAFGREAQNGLVLRKLEIQFQQVSVLSQVINSNNATELSEAFATCAGPDMLHMK